MKHRITVVWLVTLVFGVLGARWDDDAAARPKEVNLPEGGAPSGIKGSPIGKAPVPVKKPIAPPTAEVPNDPAGSASSKKHPGGPKFDRMIEEAEKQELAEKQRQAEQRQKTEGSFKQAKTQRDEANAAQKGKLEKLQKQAKGMKPKPVLGEKPTKRAAKRGAQREFRRKDSRGEHEFDVKLQTSGWVDPRLLEYLEANLEVTPYQASKGRKDEGKAWHEKNSVDERADEISVELKAPQGVDVQRYAWSWPSGFELVRPSVLRVRPELVEAFGKSKAALKLRPELVAKGIGIKKLPKGFKPAPGSFDHLELKVTCQASDSGRPMARQPLAFAQVRVGGAAGTTNAAGVVTLNGAFPNAAQSVEVVYDSQVETHGQRSGLRIMAEVHSDMRRESKTVSVRTTRSGTLVLSDVELSSHDCEMWRLGEIALSRYHELVRRSPPSGQLRIKRWSVDWGGTPYTFYDHIVLTEKWPEKGSYVGEARRRSTMHHEFGHSVRHTADGDVHHWNWDNFRWVYAREHSGCEVFNTQYAFNEGWAGYWENIAMNATPGGCASGPTSPVHAPEVNSTTQRPKFVDWVEDMVSARLFQLSTALESSVCSGASASACAAQKMVEVLERNPGEVHSMWDFEQKYCHLHHAGNSECRSPGVPTRERPAACPPGFTDDGATCRLHEVVTKPSHTRGVGLLPTNCGPSKRHEDGLCYTPCSSGYGGAGPFCWENCPGGYRDDGAFCAKPEPYGRGGGYPWQFGDSLNLDAANARCERDHGGGRCEVWGAIVYPKCREGFHNAACCICSPNCPSGMTDIGVSCAKRSYDRGIGTVPTACSGGMEYDNGLCYRPCNPGFSGGGPVCWGQCPAGFADQGALCSRPAVAAILVKY